MTPYLMFRQARIALARPVLHKFIHIISRFDDFFREFYQDVVPVADIDVDCPHIEGQHDVDGDSHGIDLNEDMSEDIDMGALRDQMRHEMSIRYQHHSWYRQ